MYTENVGKYGIYGRVFRKGNGLGKITYKRLDHAAS
jgi:hypothetical protein